MGSLVLIVMLTFILAIMLPILVLVLAVSHMPILSILVAIPSFLTAVDWILVSPWRVKWIGIGGFLLTAYGVHVAVTHLLAR